ncbi:MAG TPA: hypothetical protein VLC79_03475 [Cellvibrio sp.]|nr:hypothetical protein [Cellvibrio sp.]
MHLVDARQPGALGVFLFACMDSTTKYLTTHYNVPFVVTMRYLMHFFLMLIILAPRHSAQLIKTQRTSLICDGVYRLDYFWNHT